MSTFIMNLTTPDNEMLPISLFSIGNDYSETELSRSNGAEFHQILFVISGEGTLTCQGKAYNLKPNNAFYTGAGIPVYYKSTDNLKTAFLSVRGNALDNIMKYYKCDGFLFYKYIDIKKYISAIDNIIDEYKTKKRMSIISSLAYSFFIDFFEQNSIILTKMQEVSLYLEKNFTKKLTMKKIADLYNISVSQLAHSFKKEFGQTVFEYIINLRLSYAKNLITFNPDFKTSDISLSCGFEDVSYFCKAYKNKYGKTPKADKE